MPAKRSQLQLVAFDLETTGLDADKCDVIEVAGVNPTTDSERQR